MKNRLIREGYRTSNGMISSVLRSNSAVSIAVEARHGFLGEESERFLQDCRFITKSAN